METQQQRKIESSTDLLSPPFQKQKLKIKEKKENKFREGGEGTANAHREPGRAFNQSFISDTQQQTCNIRDAACRYLGPCTGPTIYCRLIATRNAFIILECVHEPSVRGGRKSHRGWDGIPSRGWGVIFERYASRCRGSSRARTETQWGNNAARDMRGLGRGSPPIRGDFLAEFQQRKRKREGRQRKEFQKCR